VGTRESHTEAGWRVFGGLEYLVSPRWGLTLETTYDRMFGTDEDVLDGTRDRRRYLRFRAGVVLRVGR